MIATVEVLPVVELVFEGWACPSHATSPNVLTLLSFASGFFPSIDASNPGFSTLGKGPRSGISHQKLRGGEGYKGDLLIHYARVPSIFSAVYTSDILGF